MSGVIGGLERVRLDLSSLALDIRARSEASDELYDLIGEVDGVIVAVPEASRSVDPASAVAVLPMVFTAIEGVRCFKARHGLGDVKRRAKRSRAMQESPEAPAASDRPIKRTKTKRS
jgi:hypothetical protein